MMKPKISKEHRQMLKKYGFRGTNKIIKLTMKLYNSYCDECKVKSPYTPPCKECLIKTKPIMEELAKLKGEKE